MIKILKLLTSLVYLGALTHKDNDISIEVKRRIISANRSYHGLQRHLRSKILTKKTKISIYKTLIRPVLTYGSESWPLTKTKTCCFLLNAKSFIKLEDGRHRRRYNFELEQDFGKPNIIAVVKCNRLR